MSDPFSRLWVVGILLLIGVTYPLWFSAWTRSDYPVIPWISIPPSLRGPVDGVSLMALAASLLLLLWRGHHRPLWGGVFLSLFVLLVGDQHRLQPWAYQSSLYALAMAAFSWPLARRWLIAIAISIYFYSACGKFDYQFCHTVGTDFVQAIAPTTLALQSDQAAFLALTLPAGEIVLALLLMFSRTRQAGAVLAVAMHGVLLLLLGPFGMNHSHGVLVWNGLLAIQALLLFFPKTATVKETQRSWKWTVGPVLMLALVLPCAERWGYWDHWPSWALYSPHNSRVDLEVHEVAIEQLPVSLHPFATDDDGDRWHSIDLNQWSLQQRRVPIYPQARYQLALSGAIAFGLASNDAIRAKELGVSDRFRGTRSEQFLIGVKEITQSVK